MASKNHKGKVRHKQGRGKPVDMSPDANRTQTGIYAGMTRAEHIAMRKPITEARHKRIAQEMAPQQQVPTDRPFTMSDVVMPEAYQNTGWVEMDADTNRLTANPTYRAGKPLRKAIFDETMRNQQAPNQ
jgi:hypothetical protein